MDDDKDKPDPGTNEFTTQSTWPLDSDSVYFFANNDRDSNILSDFGWNFIPKDSRPDGFSDMEPIAADESSDLAGTTSNLAVDCFPGENSSSSSSAALRNSDQAAVVRSTSPNPSASSSSSEDLLEKSTGSGGKPPPEIP